MENPFKAGDKVVTHLKGCEVEGVVRSTWKHEVQIRIADGESIWRTMKRVKLVDAPVAPVVPEASTDTSTVADPSLGVTTTVVPVGDDKPEPAVDVERLPQVGDTADSVVPSPPESRDEAVAPGPNEEAPTSADLRPKSARHRRKGKSRR